MRAHLIPRQVLKRELGTLIGERTIEDERSWVPACGGITGVGGHHGMLDGYQLQVPRERLPEGFLALLEELRLSYYLERRFGPQRALSGP